MRRNNLVRCRRLWAATALIVASSWSALLVWSQEPLATSTEAASKINFSRDILPILSARCFQCHGPEKHESSFRLDVKDVALSGGDESAPNIVPGKSADSHLIQYVRGQVDGMEMPPTGDRLSAEQIDRLIAWIDQGPDWGEASDADAADPMNWWSLKPLQPPSVPDAQAGCHNEIDAFIRSKLTAMGIEPSPEADRRTLIRRVFFDLIGLPPTPEDVQAFVDSDEPDAYQKLVDRLLDSPRYGERWARHWMDAAHFAETHGHDQDRIRENAWPYRDYLIHAFNSDKPYDRFVQEQVAGDVLFPDDPQATVALGFLAAGPWDESSLRDIREDTLDRQIARYLDRDDMISNVMNNIVSATVQCARCHDHKFDPITQADYYSLQAVFSGVERANREYDADPEVHARGQHLRHELKVLADEANAHDSELQSQETQAEVATWEQEILHAQAAWHVLVAETADSSDGTALSRMEDGSLLATGTNPERDTYSITFPISEGHYTSLRLEVLTDDSLPQHGPGRQDNGNLHLSEIELYSGKSAAERIPIARATADFNQTDWDIGKAIDGNPQTAWGIFPSVGQPHQAVFEFERDQTLGPDGGLTVVLKQLHGERHLIGRLRISISDSPVRFARLPPNRIASILAEPTDRRTDAERVELRAILSAGNGRRRIVATSAAIVHLRGGERF